MKNVACLLFLLAVVLTGSPAQAQQGEAPRPFTSSGGEAQLAALIAKSSVIVEGRAEESYCFWDAAHSLIFTATPVTVYKVFKGEVSSARVEIITWGGQVGNEANAFSDLGQVGLNLQPTGVFFLTSTPHPDPKTKVPANQAFQTVDGERGFLEYESYLKGGANTQSFWQTYPRVETSLYPVIAAQVGHPYRVVKPFDPKKFNSYKEAYLLDSLMYARMMKSSPQRPRLSVKKKQSATSNTNANKAQISGGPLATVAITSFAPITINAGTFDSLTINGSGFGTPSSANPAFKPQVKFASADQPNTYVRTPALNIIRFTNTKIVLYMPSNDGSTPSGKGRSAATGVFKVINASLTDSITSAGASPPAVTIPRSEFNVLYSSGNPPIPAYRQVRIASLNGTGGIRFKYDANVLNHHLGSNFGYPTTKIIETVIRKWRCDTQLNLGDSVFRAVPFAYGTTDCNIGFSSAAFPINSDALMATNNHFTFCTGSNGNYASADAVDILINKDKIFAYDFSGAPIPNDSVRYDFKTSLLHELGHVVGLAHVADPSVLMYRFLAPSQQKYAFAAEPEVLGADNILRRSTLANRCFAPMVALDATTCIGAQLSVSPRLFYTPCDETLRIYTTTASGATAYKWAPVAVLLAPNNNPNAATVTFQRPALPYVYGMKDGLGDFVRNSYKGMPCEPVGQMSTPAPAGLRTQVYPNPSAATFTVAYTPTAAGEAATVLLYNAQGTVLYTQELSAGQAGQVFGFELPKLPTGTYFLRTVVAGQPSETVQLYAE